MSLEPGDVVFFREDVYHRTQDALQQRVALIVDIMRLPLRSTPIKPIVARVGVQMGDAYQQAEKYSKIDDDPQYAQHAMHTARSASHSVSRWDIEEHPRDFQQMIDSAVGKQSGEFGCLRHQDGIVECDQFRQQGFNSLEPK